MRKLEEFKKNNDNLLSKNELLNVTGGVSRYTCFTETCVSNCSDSRMEKTIDENGTSTTTITMTQI